MFAEFLRAGFLAGVPVAAVSYALVWWALRNDYLEKPANLKQLEKEVSMLSRAQSKKKKHRDIPSRKLNPVHNKWLRFGGGFYGVVALVTFAIIEIGEIASFFGAFSENIGKLSDLGLDLIISVFIDQLMNVVRALAWPVYWMGRIETQHIWLWFLAAYGGYWFGARAALNAGAEGEAQS